MKTIDFVDSGKMRGEIGKDIDPWVLAALLDWIEDGLQRSIVWEELARGPFHLRADAVKRRRLAIETIIHILRRGLAPDPEPSREAGRG